MSDRSADDDDFDVPTTFRELFSFYRRQWPMFVEEAKRRGPWKGSLLMLEFFWGSIVGPSLFIAAAAVDAFEKTKERYAKMYQARVLNSISNASHRQVQYYTASSGTSVKNSGPFFSRLPPEIRRQILMLAFGDRTYHMDLSLRHPFHEVDPQETWRFTNMGGVHARIGYDNCHNNFDESKPRSWKWFGCVCHRYTPDGAWLPMGRRRNYSGHFHDPDHDLCLQGTGQCKGWSGDWPARCFPGIHGWLLSCRQAYWEGMDVIYGTTTFHIASPILHRAMQDLISPQIVTMLTSLELVWNHLELPLAEGFTGLKASKSGKNNNNDPVFPSLVYLLIAFKTMVHGDREGATNLVWPYASKKELADKLHNSLYPTIDKLLERMVPPSTDVTISCPKWDWYEQTDEILVEKQGLERTKPQRAELEGLKCWRVTPALLNNTSYGTMDGDAASSKSIRSGFWVHIKRQDVHLRGAYYDWERHNRHELGEKEYCHNWPTRV